MNPIVRRLIILGTPLVLGILGLLHPTISTGVFYDISGVIDWWIILHILQLPLFCLLALSAYLLLDGLKGTLATLSRIALGLFVIFYPAQDAILGIGAGTLVRSAMAYPDLQRVLIAASIEDLWNNPITALIITLGGLAWAVAILLAALALSRPTRSRWLVIVPVALMGLAILYLQAIHLNLISMVLPIEHLARLVLLLAIALGLVTRPHLAVGLLVMASFLFSLDHALPAGPIGMACYFVAALQLEFFVGRATPTEKDATDTNVVDINTADMNVADKDATNIDVVDTDAADKDTIDKDVVGKEVIPEQ